MSASKNFRATLRIRSDPSLPVQVSIPLKIHPFPSRHSETPPPPPPFLKSVWSPSLRDEFVWAAVQEWVSLPAGAGGRAGGRAVGAVPRGLAAVLRLHWAGRRPPQRRRRPRAPVAAAALAPPPATVVQQPLGGMGSTNVDSGGADDFGPQRMNFSFKSERSVQLCCAQPRPPGSLDLR